MDPQITFDENLEKSLEYLEKLHSEEEYYNDLKVVLSVAIKDARNLPTFKPLGKEGVSVREYTKRYADRYIKAYNNRTSVRKANPSGTFPDPIQEIVLKSKFESSTDDEIDKIVYGHSFLMSVENVIGDLLEEYLCEKLKSLGWFCCWGSSIDAVDFCKATGELLQIKNSDNSENSSSSRVRNGTEIEKWYRRFSKKENTFNWDALKTKTGAIDSSEEDFRGFVIATLKSNPELIYVKG